MKICQGQQRDSPALTIPISSTGIRDPTKDLKTIVSMIGRVLTWNPTKPESKEVVQGTSAIWGTKSTRTGSSPKSRRTKDKQSNPRSPRKKSWLWINITRSRVFLSRVSKSSFPVKRRRRKTNPSKLSGSLRRDWHWWSRRRERTKNLRRNQPKLRKPHTRFKPPIANF